MPGKQLLSVTAERMPQRKSICTSLSRASPSPSVTRRICFRHRFIVLALKQSGNIFSADRSRRDATRARWTNSMSSALRTPSNCSASCFACRRM